MLDDLKNVCEGGFSKSAPKEIQGIVARLDKISVDHALAGENGSAVAVSDIRRSILLAERGLQDVSRCLEEAKQQMAENKTAPEDIEDVSNALIQRASDLQQAISMLSGAAERLN